MPESAPGYAPEGGGGDRLRAGPEAVLLQMPAGVLIAEAPDGRVVFRNERVEAIWRGPLPPLRSTAEYAEWEGYHPNGRRYRPEEWPLARSLHAGETVEGEEIVIVRGDGTRGIVRMNSTPVREEGRIVAAVATVFEITEQKRKEAARRFLGEASALLAASLDYETTLRNVARLAIPTLADFCAIDVLREDGRIQRLAVEHVDPEQARLAREMASRYPPNPGAPVGVARALRTGRSELLPEIDHAFLRGVASDAEHLRMLRSLGFRSAMIIPLVARGRTLGVMTFGVAESGRRYGPDDLALAEELALRAALAIDNARLYDESQAASRAKSDFLAVISHELRTPLTAIIGYSELLGLGVPDPVTVRQLEQVERIEVSARHLLQLIEEILQVVSLEGGATRVRREQASVAALFRRAEVIIGPMAAAKGLALRFEPMDEDVVLETDPDRLLQVLLSLLSNAVKFTEEGEIHMAARREAESEWLSVVVRDTGIGIPPEHQERVFEPFWQVEQPITRRAGGTGLGLTIARRMLDLLGGEIRMDSSPGVGSTFTVRLPMRMSREEDPPRS